MDGFGHKCLFVSFMANKWTKKRKLHCGVAFNCLKTHNLTVAPKRIIAKCNLNINLNNNFSAF